MNDPALDDVMYWLHTALSRPPAERRKIAAILHRRADLAGDPERDFLRAMATMIDKEPPS